MGIARTTKSEDGNAAKQWLATVTDRILGAYAGSNFYQMLAQAYHDDVIFGSSPLIQYEHPTRILNFLCPCAGEYFFALGADLEVDTIYREYTYTISEEVKEFGLENVSTSTQVMAKQASNLETEVVICHAIEPNLPVYVGGKPIGYPLSEADEVPGGLLGAEFRRYRHSANRPHPPHQWHSNEQPFAAFRWDLTSNDPYGRSPAMDGYPAVAQLQVQQRRLAEGIAKQVRPPMIGSVMMRNEPMDINDGGITFVNNPQAEGFKPAFTVQPNVSEMTENIKEVQQRVFRIFFNDLFLGISQLGTVRSATEIEARQSETLIQIGPVIERTEGELDKIIKRTFAIMLRRGLFPPPPPEIAGRALSIKYVSLFC